jgi:Ca2+-binding EF-hand superfamily protein
MTYGKKDFLGIEGGVNEVIRLNNSDGGKSNSDENSEFNKWDKNGDGVIDKTEFERMMKAK